MKKRVLIIDDEPEVCEAVVDYLVENQYDAYFATSGPEGLSLVENVHPHLLLLDINMPNMDGIQVMKSINQKYPNLIIIILSGVHDIEIAKKAIEYGAVEYVTKPISLDELGDKFIRPLIGESVDLPDIMEGEIE